jgi:membrane protein
MIKALYNLIKFFARKIKDEHISAFSAQAAFFIIISFFPFIMLLLSMIRFTQLEKSDMLKLITQIFPTAVIPLMVTIIDQIYHTATSSTLIPLTAITALWSAGKGFLAIMRGLNAVYDIDETRQYIHLRIIATFYTLAFAVTIILTMGLFVFGNRLFVWIKQKLPAFLDTALVIISLRTILGFVVLIAFFLIIYAVIPNRKVKIMSELPGAMMCAAGWMGFSYAFSYYIDHFSNYSSMYGSLTAVVLFMLWMYFLMYILFIGAEFNLLFDNNDFKQRIKDLFHKGKEATHK